MWLRWEEEEEAAGASLRLRPLRERERVLSAMSSINGGGAAAEFVCWCVCVSNVVEGAQGETPRKG